jgi:hypothetical protein
MAPRTKLLFHSLLLELGQVDVHLSMDTDTSDQRDGNTTHPSTTDSIGAGPSWVVAQLLNIDQTEFETGSLYDDIDDDQGDLDLATDGESINTDASTDLCIELGFEDMIDIDEDTNKLLTIDIDPFLVIDSYVDQNS